MPMHEIRVTATNTSTAAPAAPPMIGLKLDESFTSRTDGEDLFVFKDVPEGLVLDCISVDCGTADDIAVLVLNTIVLGLTTLLGTSASGVIMSEAEFIKAEVEDSVWVPIVAVGMVEVLWSSDVVVQ